MVVIALDTLHPVRELLGLDTVCRNLRLNWTERDSRSRHRWQLRSEIAQAGADTAPQIDDVRFRNHGRQGANSVGDLIFDVPERLAAGLDAGPPYRAMNGAASLPERDERRRVPVVMSGPAPA